MVILQGIDLLKIERIKKIYLNYSDRFLEKILENPRSLPHAVSVEVSKAKLITG